MGRSWSANQRRPRSAKENVDDFMDKETSRRPATAADVPPANREFRTCSRAAYPPSYALCRSYYGHSPLCKRTCNRRGLAATSESRPALQRPDAGAALDAAAAAVPADTGAASQADSGGEPCQWDTSDDFDNYAAAPYDNPLSSSIALSPYAPPTPPPPLPTPCLNGRHRAESSHTGDASSVPHRIILKSGQEPRLRWYSKLQVDCQAAPVRDSAADSLCMPVKRRSKKPVRALSFGS